MRLTQVSVRRETREGNGEGGAYYLGDVCFLLPSLIEEYRGQAQLIYLDPPFATGQTFVARLRAGERDFQTGNASLTLPAYGDALDGDAYLRMMREVLCGCRELLSDTGSIFLHIDYRMNAKLRLLMDDIFGEKNFLNEIIWAYQTGGRAKRFFSRKHDVILFYRKGAKYFFDANAIAVPRDGNRRNHMKRHVDTDGRIYRSIRSGDKVYTYYDDETVLPGDVWDDVSHLQQKDPQRTGYDTQKPLPLLSRIVLCASRSGDLVMDLFAGSGTTLDAARTHGRRFVGVDKSPVSRHVVRRRLADAALSIDAPPCLGAPEASVSTQPGVGYIDIRIERFDVEPGVLPEALSGMDALDSWAVGYIKGDEFSVMAEAWRDKKQPRIKASLALPVFDGTPAVRLSDAVGRSFYYRLDGENT